MERTGFEPVRESIRRIYSPVLSAIQPPFQLPQFAGQLLGIEPSAVESQSTILPLNYSCLELHVVAKVPTTGLEPVLSKKSSF